MDIIDKIFNKLPKEKAPASLRAAILDIPHRHAPARTPWVLRFVVPVLAMLVLLVGGAYYRYFHVPKLAAAFELTVDDTDAAGISPDSVFVLKSSKDITATQVKKVVKISPDVEFEVENDGKNRFRIRPVRELDGNVIYKVSIEEGVGERDFSWAFQVRAQFAAISTFPRNQATGVPINSTIEVTFNREGLENPERYFEITPTLSGKLEVHADTVVFVPAKPMQEKTIYTVKFKQGLAAKGSQETLPADVVFAFETNQTSYQSYQDFGFSQELVHFPLDRTPAIQLYEYNQDFSNAEAGVYAFDGKDAFVKGYYDSRKWELGWSYYYRQSGSPYDTSKLRRVSTFKPQMIKFEYQTFFELPDKLPAGYYLLDLKVGEVRRQAWILVNDVSHYYSVTDQNGFVWAYEYSRKAPLTDATVAYYDIHGGRHDIGKTNDRGIAEFTVPAGLKNEPLDSQDYGRPKLIEIETSGKPASLVLASAGWWYNQAAEVQDDYWKYLSTDRYTYRLSDSVKFWGVMKGKSQDVREQKVKIQLREGYYYADYFPGYGFDTEQRPLAETEAVVSPFDTIAGELKFQGMKPGTYNVVVFMNDKVVMQTSVEILNYVKPLYHISVTPSKQAIFAGEPVDFNVKAEFYDGTPVGQLLLNYTGYYNQNYEGEVLLNAKGEGKVTITPQYSKDMYYLPSNLNLTFRPALAEEADISSESTGSVLVFGPRIYLQASQQYNDNNNFAITAKANDIVIGQTLDNRDTNQPYPEYIGKPSVGVQLAAEVEKTEYLQIEDGTVYDPINKTSVPQYRYEERKTIISRLTGQTNGNGEWVFTLNLPKQERAYYQIRIRGTDGGGRDIQATVWPYYYKDYGSVYYSGSVSAANRVILSLGFDGGEREYEKRFSVGEDVKLVAEAMEGGQHLSGQTLFYRYGHAGIGTLELVNGMRLQEKFSEDFKPAASYKAVVFGPYGFVESNSLLAAYQQEDSKLTIEIKPDKPAYRPGETATVDIVVKDKDGKTHDGEVNLSVVDEAVFDVVPYYWQQDILSSLYAIDYSEPRSDASDFAPPAFQQNGGAEGGGCFLPDTQILLPDGKTKAIKDIKVGDRVLTRADETDGSRLVPAIVQGISRHSVDTYLVINGSLKVTEEHSLYVNGKWLAAGFMQPGDTLQNEHGQMVKVASITKVLAPKTMVYNINVGAFHTYYAGGYFVHNAEKGGGYRSQFLDTAHFESKPLNGGTAHFEFKLPDNITSWRATVNAFESRGVYAGQESKLLPASLPFFADAIISETYLSGDKPVVTVRSFGTEFNTGADASYTVDVDAINFHESKTVKGGSVDFALPALSVGNYELRIKAKQGNMEDGIVRKFSVMDSYFLAKEAKIANLTDGLAGLSGNASGYTDVTFTDAGKARFYQDVLWSQYQGGKRADQVAAAYLARQTLRDYFGSSEDPGQLDLSAYHVPDAGIALFTYGDSDLELSAKLADTVPNAVYQPQLIQYFRKAIRDEKADIHRITVGLYGLAALNQPVLAKLQFMKDEKDLSLEDRMYIALAFAKLGDKEGARKYYDQYIRPELRFEGDQAWMDKEADQTKRVKLTTLSGAVAATIGHHEDALAVWKYISEHYPAEDLDILERFLLIRSEIANANQEEARFTYEVGGQRQSVRLEKGTSKTLRFSREELTSLRFTDIRGQPTAVSVIENYRNPDSLPKNGELSIRRKFLVSGRETTAFTEGDTVLVHLEYTIARSAVDGGYQVVDYLPSGLKPITNIWERGLATSYNRCYEKGFPVAVEGNAVYFSGYHNPDAKDNCATYTVEYYARAAAKGEFRVNPPLIQSLEDYDSLNVGSGQTVTVSSQRVSLPGVPPSVSSLVPPPPFPGLPPVQ